MIRRALAGLALALSAACSGGATAPTNTLGGPFTLKLYNGANLPAYVDEAFGYCGAMVVAATLTEGSNGRVTLSQSTNSVCTPGAPATTSRAGSVAIDGSAVTITMDADAGDANRIYVGTVANGVLTLNHLIDYGPRQLTQFYTFVRS